MNWKCMKCGKESPSSELVDYEIPDGTCGVYKKVSLGEFHISVCKNCNKDWVATERYLGKIRWIKRENEFAHYLFNYKSKGNSHLKGE